MLGIFVSLDLFLYYAFWELSLVPMTLLIATFGRTDNRRRAAIKFFLYTFIPSALLLVAMLWLYARPAPSTCPTLAAARRARTPSPPTPPRSGSPRSPSSSPSPSRSPSSRCTAGSPTPSPKPPPPPSWCSPARLGLYSILRFSFGIFPEQSRRIAPLMIALGAIGIVYGALLALVQNDLKRLAAYATLGALSFIVLGIFTFTIAGLDGGIYQILNESLAGAALFMLLGLLYERYGTYDMRDYGGLAAKLPWMVTLFVITALSVVGLPMLNGFVGEFLILSGSMQSAHRAPHPLDRRSPPPASSSAPPTCSG